MKQCNYCGRENDDEAVSCRECGTDEFKTPAPELPPKLSESTTAVPEKPPENCPPKFEFRALTAAEMQMDLVTLLTCRTLLEAQMIVSQLDGAGITAFIPDEFLMQAVSWNLITYGYVRVQVSPKDYEPAKEFLLAAPEVAEPGDTPHTGPATTAGGSGVTGGPPSVS